MQSEMAGAQGATDGLERTSQGDIQESPQKEGPSAPVDEQVDKKLDSPQNEHNMHSRTEFASPVSLKNFNHSLMSTGLN